MPDFIVYPGQRGVEGVDVRVEEGEVNVVFVRFLVCCMGFSV